ncbi:MAG: DUF4956 domain-containing protein [Arenicella sp.]
MSNYDFLKSLLTTIPEDSRNISLYGFAFLVIVSIVMALLIAHLYTRFFDANSTGSRIHRAFPLMGPAVTTIFLTVQFSLPLSLGLLGALSIVRFRTPIKEPEEIGFILLVIACSISIATYNIAFAALLYVIVFIALLLLQRTGSFNSANANAVVLNLLISDEPAESSMTTVQAITEKLKAQKIKHTISSVHVDENKTNASILLKNHKDDDFGFITAIAKDFSNVSLDYYRR